MNGVITKISSTIVKEYKFDNSLLTEIDSKIDSCFEDCHNSYFHKFKYERISDTKFTIITNNEIIVLTNTGKGMNLYDLKKIKSCWTKWFYI